MAISTPMLVTFCVYIFGMILIGFIAFWVDAVWVHS